MNILPFDPSQTQAMRQICIGTSSIPTEKPKQLRFLLGMYCDCYLEHGLAYMLTDEENIPRGYILCAPEYRDYVTWLEPYIRAMGFPYGLMARFAAAAYRPWHREYPAHLHIDILEDYTGRGNGSRLMEALLGELRRRKVPGVMLHVSTKNTRAIGFYRKCGFRVLKKDPFTLTLGQTL